MKTYTAKTVEDAVNKACLDLGVTVDQLNYEVTLETKGLFSKKACDTSFFTFANSDSLSGISSNLALLFCSRIY
jgi:predicted RNA-binding protein Jag